MKLVINFNSENVVIEIDSKELISDVNNQIERVNRRILPLQDYRSRHCLVGMDFWGLRQHANHNLYCFCLGFVFVAGSSFYLGAVIFLFIFLDRTFLPFGLVIESSLTMYELSSKSLLFDLREWQNGLGHEFFSTSFELLKGLASLMLCQRIWYSETMT